MKKTMLLLIGLLSMLYGVSFGYVQSEQYNSKNTCENVREKNNKLYPSYVRSNCYSKDGYYYYNICQEGESCNTSVSNTNTENSSDEWTGNNKPYYIQDKKVIYKEKLDSFLGKLVKLKDTKYKGDIKKYLDLLDGIIGKLNKLEPKYKNNDKITSIISYLKDGINLIKEHVKKEEADKTKEDGINNFFCDLQGGCNKDTQNSDSGSGSNNSNNNSNRGNNRSLDGDSGSNNSNSDISNSDNSNDMTEAQFCGYVVAGNISKVREYLEQGGNVDAKDPKHYNFSVLGLAASRGYLDIVKLLLLYGADVNEGKKYELTPLIQALRKGNVNVDIVKLLLGYGANVNAKDGFGRTPLMYAAMKGNLDVVKVLVRYGANINMKGNNGETALSLAAMKGPYHHLNVVNYLENLGKNNSNNNNSGSNITEAQFFEYVAAGNRSKVTEYIEQGGNVDAKDPKNNSLPALSLAARKGDLDMVKLLLGHGANVNIRTKFGFTPLMKAVQKGNYDIVLLLIRHGADINMETDTWSTALSIAKKNNKSQYVVDYLDYLESRVNNNNNSGSNSNSGNNHYSSSYINVSESQFFGYVYDGNRSKVTEYLEQGGNVDAINKHGMTLLMYAVYGGHLNIVKSLLSHGANVNAATSSGRTPLMYAAARGHLDIVEYLVSHGANVNAATKIFGYTPLMEAIIKGDLDMVKFLLGHGANVNATRITSRSTPLMEAASKGNLDIVKLLIRHGANMNMKTNVGYTALDFARTYNRRNVVNYLENLGKNNSNSNSNKITEAQFFKYVEAGNISKVKEYIEHGGNVDAKDPKNHNSPVLSLAVRKCNLDIVGLLLSHGANVNARDRLGYTPLMYAARDERYEHILLYLVSYGADINAKNNNGETALSIATKYKKGNIVNYLKSIGNNSNSGSNITEEQFFEYLGAGNISKVTEYLKQGGNVDAKDPKNYNSTALMEAARKGNLHMVGLLLRHGANVDARGYYGSTPLMDVAQGGNLYMVKFLLGHGANVNATRITSRSTPLMEAARKGNLDIVKLLISNGADINMKTNNGDTALSLARKYKKLNVVNYLESIVSNNRTEEQFFEYVAAGNISKVKEYLEQGGNVDAKDPKNNNSTALSLAAYKGNVGIVKLLLGHGADVNARSKYGVTPLMEAAQGGNLYMVGLLIRHGANINMKTDIGETALSLATKYKNLEVINYLESIIKK